MDKKKSASGYDLLLSARGLAEQGETSPLLGAGKEFKSQMFNHSEVIAVLILVLGVGISAAMFFEGWSFITSLYVVVQIITTVGYGEFTVTSDAMRVFMSFYVLACLVILAYYINTYLQQMVDWQCDAIRRHLRQLERVTDGEVDTDEDARMKYGALNKAISTTALFLFVVAFGTIFYRLYEHCACPNGLQERAGCRDTDYATCAATGGFKKTLSQAFYMSVITMTTVGFGDYQPRSEIGRLVGCAWMLLGVVITVNFVNALSMVFLDKQSHTTFKAKDLVEGVDEQTFKKIDQNNDGRLSRGEFLSYTLLKYGLVNEELLDEINKAFDKLDSAGTNAVTLDMIKDGSRRSPKGDSARP